MAFIRKVTRIANPRRAKAKRRATLKRRVSVKARPVRRKKRTVKRSNPMPVLLEFGAINPRKRRKSVAKTKNRRRRRNPSRHVAAKVNRRHRRRRNPVMKAANRHHRRRRRNPMVKVYNRRRRHNPSVLNKATIETSGGVLLGLALVRALPGFVPASISASIPQSSFTGPLISCLATAVAAWLVSKVAPADVAKGVAYGGGALTLSQLITAMGAPTQVGVFNYGLQGVGDIVATQGFAVPDRDMRAPVIQMAPQGVGTYGQGSYRRLRA